MRRCLYLLIVLYLSQLAGADDGLPRSPPTNIEFQSKLGILFVFSSGIDDLGWTSRQNIARIAIERAYPTQVVTAFEPDVASTYNASYPVFRAAARSGIYRVIFGCSIGYEDSMAELALDYPDILWIHVGGHVSTSSNFIAIFGKIFQARYLNGVLAGLFLRNSSLPPIVAAASSFAGFPVVYQDLNALYLGIRSVLPEVEFIVADANTWADAIEEEYIAKLFMFDYHAQVLANFQDSPTVPLTAVKAGRYALGYHSDMGHFLGNNVLSSSVWDWAGYYVTLIGRLLDGNLTQGYDWWGDARSLVFFPGMPSPLVDPSIRHQVDEIYLQFLNGSFDVFCGARADPWRTPKSAYCLSDDELLRMDSYHPAILYLGAQTYPLYEVHIGHSLTVAMQVLASLAIFCCCFIQIFFTVHARHRVLQAASPLFLHLALVGASIMLAAVYPLSVSPPTAVVSCVVPVWLIFLGFCFFFTAVLLKSMRIIYILLMSESYVQVRVPFSHLAILEIAFSLLCVLLLALYTFIDPPFIARSAYTSGLAYNEYRTTCHYQHASTITLAIIFSLAATLLLIGCILSFLVRRAPKELHDVKETSFCIYDMSFVLGVLAPAVIVIESPTARYLITTLGLIFGTMVAVLVLFAPKIYQILVPQESSIQLSSTPLDPESSIVDGTILRDE